MENSAQFYYEQLKASTNPGPLLASFYMEVTGNGSGKSEIIMMNKLIKMFGRFTVFFSVMDLGNYTIEGPPYALLYTICKSRFEKQFPDSVASSSRDLTKVFNKLEKELDKIREKETNEG